MNSMFGGGFKASKCKTLLRLAMARIKLLRNKRDMQVKQMRKDIAQLLSAGQEPSARIRVEHIVREQNILAAYDIVELFCELIIVRLPIIESQKVCPMDLKEAVSSLIFASPRCADLPELLQIRSLFSSKYGKEFVAAAAELRPECGVNRRIIEKLSVRAPSGELKLKLLTEIAEEHNVNWDPADSEAELLKQPEDLLDGPKKFFPAGEAPTPEPQPSPPKLDEAGYPQRASPVPPQAPPPPTAPPAPAVTRQSNVPVLSSESEEDVPSGEKKQFIPFVGPLPTRGVPAAKGSSSGKFQSSSSEKARKEGHMDYEGHGDYDNVAAAAKAAAQSADRAVAAARAAAELAKTHPSKRESLSRNTSTEVDSSSSEEESEEEEEVVETKSSSRSKHETVRPERSVSFAETKDTEYYQEKPDLFYRSDSDNGREGSFRRSNSDDKQEAASRRLTPEDERDYPEDRPEKDLNPTRRVVSEEENFWRSGDQDWRQAANLRPETNINSGGFFSNRGDEHDSLYQRDSDLFKRNESAEFFPSRPKERESYTSTSKLFSSSGSANNLFKRSGSEEFDYNSQQGFATPKFDEDENPFSNPTLFSSDLSFKRDIGNERPSFDSPRSKPSYNEFWRSPSFSHPSDEAEGVPGNTSSLGSEERQGSGPHSVFDPHLDDSQTLARGGSDPVSSQSYSRGEDAAHPMSEDQRGTSPIPTIPTKSRRTRNTSKGRDNLEGGGGSGGLPPPHGRGSKFSSSENIESARSPDYHSPSEPDNATHSFDDSPNFPPRTSLNFYNSLPRGSAPPDRVPPSRSSAYQSPGRDSSPSVEASSQSSRTSPSLERRDSPSAPSLHPNLPDYDDLTARFEALKGKTRR